MFENEACLWKAFQEGDLQAFELIYQRHATSMLAYGKRLCTDPQLVADCVQDVFIDIWTQRKTLRSLSTIRYYLFRIMRNKLARAYPLMTVPVGPAELLHDDQLSPSIEHLITQQESRQQQVRQLQEAIQQLPGRQREAIMLAFYHDFSNEEIAGIMGINQQSVVNHLNRAFTTLRELVIRSMFLLLAFLPLA